MGCWWAGAFESVIHWDTSLIAPPQGSPSGDPFNAVTRPNGAVNWRGQSGRSSGCQVALADGSVRNVTTSVSPATYRAAVIPNDGIQLGSDW